MTSLADYVWFGTGLMVLAAATITIGRGVPCADHQPVQFQFRLVVLAGVALAMTTCGVIVTRLLGRSPYVAISAAQD